MMEQPSQESRRQSGRGAVSPGSPSEPDGDAAAASAMGDPSGGDPTASSQSGASPRAFLDALRESFARPLPAIAGLELASASVAAPQPSRAGGDVRDVFALPDGRVLLLIGQIAGGGVEAAALAESVCSAVRAVAVAVPSPRCVLDAVNQLLLQERRERRVTACLALLDPRDGDVLVAGAAHPAPIHVGGAAPRSLPAPSGPALGEQAAEPYPMRRFHLEASDTIILFADGRSATSARECAAAEPWLLERLARLGAVGARDYADAMLRWAPELAPGPAGDAGVVVAQLTCVEYRSSRELTLAAPLASWRLGEIRQGVRSFLLGHQLSAGIVDDLVLCVEEACTNVIRHSGSATPGRITVTVDSRGVEVVVKDEGRGFGMVLPNPPDLPGPLAGGGRGLYLMARLCDEIELWNEGGACVRLWRSSSRHSRLHSSEPFGSGGR